MIADQLEQALLTSVQQQAAEGVIPPADLARIMDLVRSNKLDLADAVAKVQKEAQERQAEQVPAGAPEAQPGLALPGMGAEAGVAPPPESAVGPSLQELIGAL